MPTRRAADLPARGLTAALDLTQHEPASERSIYIDVTSDALRFNDDRTPVAPADVPLVAFSETLRDVALVVAAARPAVS
jgi:hypothetical protein